VFFTCQVIPYFAVGTFVAQVLGALHLQGGYQGGLVYNAALLLGAIAGVPIVHRLSRRLALIGSFGTAAVAMGLLSIDDVLGPVMTLGLFAVFAGVLSAASNLVYVYLPELFPTHLRASGIGLAIASSRIGSAVSTFLLPVVVAGYGVHAALGACMVVLALGALVCARFAPETRHVRMSEAA
jgi:putative MFS transporter